MRPPRALGQSRRLRRASLHCEPTRATTAPRRALCSPPTMPRVCALVHSNWEPNPKVITEDDFVRVRLTDPTDCQPYGSPYDRSRRDSYSSRMYSRACDFPTQSIIKMARTELSFRDAPAYKFATDFRLTFDQISSIMTNDSLTQVCAPLMLAVSVSALRGLFERWIAPAAHALDMREPASPLLAFYPTMTTDADRPPARACEQAANSSDDSFNRACGFLRYASPGPSCTVSDGGCWTSWVSEARDELPQSWRKLPFAPIFAQPSLGIYVSEQLIMYITMLFIVTAIYVFLRGDDGYSSGRAGMTLPHLMRFLIGCPVRIFKFTRSTKVLTASSKGGDETKPTAVTRAHVVRQGTAQWLDMGQMAENSITLGRAQIIIAATDRYVAVPILRLDKSDCTSSVLLRTRDGLHGNAAQFGRDYGPIRATASDVGAPSGADHQLRLDFAPKSRLRFVYVDILKRTKRVTGEHDWAVFTIHMSNVSDAGGGMPAIGPVSSCAVRIIKPGKFPSLPESIGLGEIGTMKNNAKPAVTRLGSNMTRLGLVNHVGLGKARGLGLSTLKHGSDVFLRLSLVHAFITESFRIGGLKKKVVWHQIAYFLLAIESSFLYPLMYSYIISFGVQARRQDMAVWIALWMLTLLLGKYRIKLNYFHGSMLVLQHLRAMLARKFLSLREYDHMVHPKIAQDFRVAIQSTCEEIRNQTWKGVFHNGLPNLYKVVWSVAYLLAFQWKDSTILIVSILFAIVCAICMLARTRSRVSSAHALIDPRSRPVLSRRPACSLGRGRRQAGVPHLAEDRGRARVSHPALAACARDGQGAGCDQAGLRRLLGVHPVGTVRYVVPPLLHGVVVHIRSPIRHVWRRVALPGAPDHHRRLRRSQHGAGLAGIGASSRR